MSNFPVRPQTPQAMLHRLPDKLESSNKGNTKPSKYIILIMASTTVAGKVQIAKSVSKSLSCPLYQGDSLHETSAKAASVGVPRQPTGADSYGQAAASGANEARYQRMWLSKMTRTGHLFPGESRPANGDFSGFGGTLSNSSRRGSSSSVASSSTSSIESSFILSATSNIGYINKPPVFTLSEDETLREANPALLIVTHPYLEKWHKNSIREAVGEYGIGVVFVPLYNDEELPSLKPLDPKSMTSFASLGSFSASQKTVGATLDEEIVLRVNVEAKVEALIEEIIDGVREIMNT